MLQQQRVIVYGDSVVLAGVQASLDAYPNLEVIALDVPTASLPERVSGLHPSAVIFDLGSTRPDFPLAILQQSDLLLIGIDPDGDQVWLWSGQNLRELSSRDLVGVIHQQGSKTDL